MTAHRARFPEIYVVNRWYAAALSMLLALLVVACATEPKVVNHAFGFNAQKDSPRYEVLAYKYGDGEAEGTSSDVSIGPLGANKQGTNANGPMPLGDKLYVKWREKSTGRTYEDTLKLRALLPRDMTSQRIHFAVDGPQLFVYLKDMNHYPDPEDPISGPYKPQIYLMRQIYPR